MGTKKPVTQPRLEQHKCEMKKGMEKNPKPNSIFGLGGDLASFNLEVFAYSDLWDHHSLQLHHKAGLVVFWTKPQRLPAPPERWLWKQVRVLQFWGISFFFLALCPWQSNLRHHYLLTLKKKIPSSERGKGNLEVINTVGLVYNEGLCLMSAPIRFKADIFGFPKERRVSLRKLLTIFIHIQVFSLFSDEGIGSVLKLLNGPLTPVLVIFFN